VPGRRKAKPCRQYETATHPPNPAQPSPNSAASPHSKRPPDAPANTASAKAATAKPAHLQERPAHPRSSRMPGNQDHRVKHPPPVLLTGIHNLPHRSQRGDHVSRIRPELSHHPTKPLTAPQPNQRRGQRSGSRIGRTEVDAQRGAERAGQPSESAGCRVATPVLQVRDVRHRQSRIGGNGRDSPPAGLTERAQRWSQ